MELGAGIGREYGTVLLFGRHSILGCQSLPSPLFPALYLWFEQIDCAGQSQDQDHGDNEQAGIEMPAPDHPIERSSSRQLIHDFTTSPLGQQRTSAAARDVTHKTDR